MISIDEVKARWVFSELRSERSRDHYLRVPSLDGIRQAIAVGTEFDTLNAMQIQLLADALELARPNVVKYYLQGILHFRVEDLSKERLRDLYAMQLMTQGRLIQIKVYETEPACNPDDARVVAAQVKILPQPINSWHPATIGGYNGLSVLVDGYCRSMMFLRLGQRQDCIPIYVPVS
jgi:hypothetical protein